MRASPRHPLRARVGLLAIAASSVSAPFAPAAVASPLARASDRDCADFSNQAQAQQYFLERGGPGSDPDRLDGSDNDGIACESLPCPCNRSTRRGTGGGSEPRRNPRRSHVIAARIVSVTDGDTVKVRYGRTRRSVRIIGIDTPETRRPGVAVECGGPQASANMKRLAPLGASVMLRSDPTQDTIDRYGRLLAYLERRGRDLGRAQIARGWAKTYVYRGRAFRRLAAYRRSQRTARRLRRGVHGRCGGDFHSEQAGVSTSPRAVTSHCGTVSYGGRTYVLYHRGTTSHPHKDTPATFWERMELLGHERPPRRDDP